MIYRHRPILRLNLLLSLHDEYTRVLSATAYALQCQLLPVSMSDTLSNWHCGPDAETRPEKWLALQNGYWKWLTLWNRKVLVCRTLYSSSVGRASDQHSGLNHGWIFQFFTNNSAYFTTYNYYPKMKISSLRQTWFLSACTIICAELQISSSHYLATE